MELNAPPDEPKAVTLEEHLRSAEFLGRLSVLLPKHLSTDRFAAIVLSQLARVPRLNDCSLRSVLNGVVESATLGLEIGTQGESWLVPYNVKREMNGRTMKVLEAQLQVGVWGYMKLAHNSGRISSVQVDVVMEGDEWSFRKGTSGHLHHVPRSDRDIADVDGIRWVYAVVMTDKWEPVGDGRTDVSARGVYFDAFPKAWIERIRSSAQSYDSPAWTNWYAEQAIAKCLKRVLKVCPKSRELARAITMTDALDGDAVGGQVWDVDASRLISASSKADPVTEAARAEMSKMGADPGREPEPAKRSAKAPSKAKAARNDDDPGPDERGPAQGRGGKLGWE